MSTPADPHQSLVDILQLANTLADVGEIDASLQHFRRAQALKPDNPFLHDDIVYLLQFHPGATDHDLIREAALWHWQHSRALAESIAPHTNNRDPSRRLKVGYVSPEFFRQAESHFIIPLLRSHDRAHFEIHCYSSVEHPDDRTAEIKLLADAWHDVAPLTDEQLAEKIRADQIDILIDLTMHMRKSRLLTFARKPAPVQVAWLAYPGGTGLPTIEWRLSDCYLDPPDQPGWSCERPWRLPDCWICYDPLSQAALPTPRTAGPITFGSLNHPRKLNDLNLRQYARILSAVEGSRIILRIQAESHQRRALQIFHEYSVAPDRIEFLPPLPRWEFLRAHDRIDIALDTLPYNGITTTCDAIWMGTPVVTQIGSTIAGRAGLGILSTLGLPQLIASSPQQMIDIAVKLAANRAQLIDFKRHLRRKMESSPLMDAGRFARNVETAYRAIWQRWCDPPPPNSYDAIPSSAIAHHDAGRLADAEAVYRQLLLQNPKHPEAMQRLGMIAIDAGKPEKAIELLELAVAADPRSVEPYYYLGNARKQMGRLDDAIASFQKAISLGSDLPEPRINLGGLFLEMARPADAVESFRKAVDLSPDAAAFHSNLLLALNYLPDKNREEIFQEHQTWARIHADPLTPAHPPKPGISPDRPLRIGYVSADFWTHSVSYFLLPVLERHDRKNFQVYCYSNTRRADEITQRIKSAADVWRDITNIDDAAAADLVRSDGIDILVDLSGHTAGNRLLLFAHRPASVQITWLGYPNTTGMEAIDYRFTDAIADPPGLADTLHTEQLYRLSGCAWCYQPPPHTPDLQPREPGPVTFGCFSAFAKLSPNTIQSFAEILRQTPGSRLLIKSIGVGESSGVRAIIDQFSNFDIDPARIEMLPAVSDLGEHLRRYRRVDISLDTFPYNGTTTTCESLFMDVPVVTLAGRTHISRVGASLLTALNLPDLIATSPDEFISLAVALAMDAPRLAHLRATLRSRMQSSPLMDASGFTRKIEYGYRQLQDPPGRAGG